MNARIATPRLALKALQALTREMIATIIYLVHDGLFYERQSGACKAFKARDGRDSPLKYTSESWNELPITARATLTLALVQITEQANERLSSPNQYRA